MNKHLKFFQEIQDLDVESEEVKREIIEMVRNEYWYLIYTASKLLSREISVLIDCNDEIWVDWGTVSQVKLSPPVGAKLPFKLWIHTHPCNNAYWSFTDRQSLEVAKTILEKALVLGEDGILSAQIQSTFSKVNGEIVRNLSWTEEDVTSWFEHHFQDHDWLKSWNQ